MTILPGATIGILGSGQLGRMLSQAAHRLGYRVTIYSPEADSPAGAVSERELVASYTDRPALQAFARSVQVVTFEFENVDVAAADTCAQVVPVRPGAKALQATQHRLREKRFLARHGFPMARFEPVETPEALDGALESVGLPCVLKTAGHGYDGKGQVVIRDAADVETARRQVAQQPCVLEAWVAYEAEVSVVVARGVDGGLADYGVIENQHRNQILDVSVAPASLPPPLYHEAVATARGVAEALDAVGVIAVEFFVVDGQLLVNEIAPRVHNSGHLTQDACMTGQFEQHVRAICGLPLGVTRLRQPAAMANLLGDLWEHGEPNWPEALAMGDVRLTLYGKREPRPGRKMGHLVALADDPAQAELLARTAREALARHP